MGDLASPDRRDLIIAIVVGLIVFAVYLRTIAPGLLIDDSGEFQTMARLLGHTHPTGYETYTLAARVFSLVPIGDAATRVTAFSSFMGGIAAGLIYIVSRLLRSPRAIAVVPALAFAAAPTVWSQGIIAEVYTPAAALVGVILVCLLMWQRSADGRLLAAAGAAGGFALGVHFSTGLYLIAIALFILLVAMGRNERLFSAEAWRVTWRPAVVGAAIGIVGVVLIFVLVDVIDPPSQYFDAVVAPSHSAWDLEEGQIDGVFERLRFDWTARQFSGLMFTQDGLMGERWESFRADLPNEVSWPLLLSGLVGLGWLVWRNWRAAVLIVVALVTQLVFAFNYDIGDMIYVFYIPAYMLIVLLAAAGLSAVNEAIGLLPLNSIGRSSVPIAIAGLALVLAVYPIASVNNEYVIEGTTPPYEFEAYPYNDYVASIMQPSLSAMVADLPDEAIVFGDWDDLYPRFWIAHIEQGRTDLMFHETYPADDQEGMAASAVAYIVEMSAKRPVFVPDRISELSDAGLSYIPMRIGPIKMLKVTR